MVDGVRGAPRPVGISVVDQVYDADQALSETRVISVGEPMPSWGPLPVDELRRARNRKILLGGAAAGAGLAVGLYTAHRYTHARFWELGPNAVPDDDLQATLIRSNALLASSAAMGLLPDSDYRSYDVGLYNYCGVGSDGGVDCAGSDAWDLDLSPAGVFETVVQANDTSLAFDGSGGVSCWGTGYFDTCEAPTDDLVVVDGGAYHLCAITALGELSCWGRNDFGETDPPTGAP